MAKVVMMPRNGTLVKFRPIEKKECACVFDEGTLRFDCMDCFAADDSPTEQCLVKFREALEAYPEATNILLLGRQDIWLREKGVESLRSLISAERTWDEFCSTIRALPCHHSLSMERTSRFLERCHEGRLELFCAGEGEPCQECVRSQEMALDTLRSGRRRARRNVAADRFRIVEVMTEGLN
jgi:hypothetical protein